MDARKYYEHFCFKLLEQRARRAGVPTVLIRVCLNAYRGLRVVKLLDYWAVVGYAEHGLPAGCIFAFLWVCVYSVPGLDRFVLRCPGPDLDV